MERAGGKTGVNSDYRLYNKGGDYTLYDDNEGKKVLRIRARE